MIRGWYPQGIEEFFDQCQWQGSDFLPDFPYLKNNEIKTLEGQTQTKL